MGIRPTHLHLLLLLFPCLESLLDIFDQVEHVHQPRSRPSSMLWASPKGAVEKAKEERIQKWESPKCKVQSAPKMLNLHFLHKCCLGVWEDNSINPAHGAGKRERHDTWIWLCNSNNREGRLQLTFLGGRNWFSGTHTPPPHSCYNSE